MNTTEMSNFIAKAASDKKARDIVMLDMRNISIITDYFIVCSANSTTQVKAIADNIEVELAKQNFNFKSKEGYREGRWVLLDYCDCVVHIFLDEDREFYNLERLWSEAPQIKYE